MTTKIIVSNLGTRPAILRGCEFLQFTLVPGWCFKNKVLENETQK